jgi:poly(hydroxyalkanoate) depolymerase family esterase
LQVLLRCTMFVVTNTLALGAPVTPAKDFPAMALLDGHDGILGNLMKLAPQALGKAMPSLDIPGFGAPESAALIETTAFGDNPGNLRMLSYVPDALPAGAPLVVVLHGCTQTAAEYDRGTGWSTLAERFGFALLLPEQRRANNANLCFDWFQPEDITRGSGEAASVAAMVNAMIDTHRLQRQRVYVTGLSAGGGMTAALLATYPDIFAGGAVIAGLPFGSASNIPEAFGVMGQGRVRSPQELGDRVRAASSHRGPWPTVSIWQGTSDTTVNPVNAEELRKQWANVHGVTDAAPIQSTVDGAAHREWQAADGRAVVETYVINGLGHATPIDPNAADEDAQCGDTSASRFILPAGISSTYRIAESWGLIGRRRTARQPANAGRPEKTAPRTPAWQDFLPGGRQQTQDAATQRADAASLVAKVLRSVGLVKDGTKG